MRFFLPAFTLFVLVIISCKKEYPAYPYHNISSFYMQDANGDTLQAAIQDDQLIIYWPPFQEVPDSVTPVIQVSERAVVQPASGIAVAFNNNTSYTVKAQDGSTMVYHLKTVINQPPVDFTINAANSNEAGQPLYYADNGLYQTIDLISQFFIPDTSQTAVYLVSATGVTAQLSVLPQSLSSLYISAAVPDVVPAGMYKVKVVSGYRSFTNEQTVEVINVPVPAFTALSVKKGQSFTITGKLLNAVSAISGRNANGRCNFIIQSANEHQITLQVPADAPLGALTGALTITYSGGSLRCPVSNINGEIVITE